VRWLLAILIGCSSGTTTPTTTDAIADEDPIFGGARPVALFRAPDGWDRKQPIPLVMVLHGYGAGGYPQAAFFGLIPLVEEKKFLLVAPDGTPDKGSKRFWNAVDTCCDFGNTGVDDVKYLTGLVDEIATRYNVSKVYLVGHSNGGAMSYRLACDASKKFAAAVVLAPPFWSDFTKCQPTAPVAIRHMHGTNDETVPYDGSTGFMSIKFPPAESVIDAWSKWNGCTGKDTSQTLDIDRKVAGAETKVTKWTGCGAPTEFWKMEGSGHVPTDMTPELPRMIWSFFEQSGK
jgi:polyhydroxybutyrate depolymerase